MRKMLLLLLFSAIVIACTKSSSSTAPREQTTGSNNGNPQTTPLYEDAKKYTEFVCVVNNCAGTICQETKGSCKAHACEPVPGGCTGSRLSQEQIEIFATQHATNMVKKGYIEQSDFNRSKDLAKQILQNKN